MKAYWFVDIALDKRCYRCHKVIANSEDNARQQLRSEDQWIACVGSKPSIGKIKRRQVFLDYNKVPECVAKLGLNFDQLDKLLQEANSRLGFIITQNQKLKESQ